MPSGLYPGLRFYKLVGFQEFDSTTGTAALVDNRYNTYMKPQYHGDGDVYFAKRKVIRWNTSLVDQNVTPTLAQARDPNWAGYNWQGTTEIDNMMDAVCVAQNKAKICMQISVSATSGDPVPAFMLANGWAWTGSNSQERVKFCDATARQYAANLVNAAIDRYNLPQIGRDSGTTPVGT